MRKKNIYVYILIIIISIIFLFPLYWMISTSFKSNDVLLKYPPQWFPINPTLKNYANIFSDSKFLVFYKNTIIVSLCTTILSVSLAVFASYSFSRFRFKGSNFLQIAFLSTQMFPNVALLIALYTLYRKLNLLNTYTALILACTTVSLPLNIWVMKGFFDGIPKTLEEASYIDGCGRFRALFSIILPLTTPGILAISINAFIISWNDFLWGLTLVNKIEMRTLSSGIALAYLGEYNYDWAKVMTAAVGASLPILIIFIFLQKYMVAGLVSGAIKE